MKRDRPCAARASVCCASYFRQLAVDDEPISNDILEQWTGHEGLTDGIDSTLIELAIEEVGEDELRKLA